jgi:two-component system response regulator PilR (NtrC family)
MHSVGTAKRDNLLPWLAAEDEHVAGRFPARLLITASTQRGVETLARRIHARGPRAQFPFVHTSARDLPVDPEALTEYCSSLLDAAAGGSILIDAVEEMPLVVQGALIDLLERLEFARRPSPAVRLISGTTVSLLDRVAAGAFSDWLFYRLNVIHLTVGDDRGGIAST